MENILYLINQGKHYYEEKEAELMYSYYLDAWLSLKNHMISEKITMIEDLENDEISSWFNDLYLDLNEYKLYEESIELHNEFLEFLNFKNHKDTDIRRNIADNYYFLNDEKTAEKTYEDYISKYPDHIQFYYAYALYNKNDTYKTIALLEKGIEKAAVQKEPYLIASYELLIELYEEIDDFVNVAIMTEKMNKLLLLV